MAKQETQIEAVNEYHRLSRIINHSTKIKNLADALTEWSYEADLCNKVQEDSVRCLIDQLRKCSDLLDD